MENELRLQPTALEREKIKVAWANKSNDKQLTLEKWNAKTGNTRDL